MTTENQLLREFVHAADTQDPLFDAPGWIERARAALAHPAQPAQGGEAVQMVMHDELTHVDLPFSEAKARVLEMPLDVLQQTAISLLISRRMERKYTAPPASQEQAPSPTYPNLACKSVQARLAAQWGYVRQEQAQQPQVDDIDVAESVTSVQQRSGITKGEA